VLLITILIGIPSFSACSSLLQAKAPWPTEGWHTSSPEEQDMDSAILNQMMERIDERDAPIDSVIVVRNGYIVFEQYRNDYDQDSSHHIQSVTKSFTSTLVGIAIQEGFIENVDQRVLDFFPERTIANLDARKQNLTLENLLTMSDGMDWHELDYPYTDPNNSLGQMWRSKDVIQHVLDHPMVRDPGDAWSYNSGTSILLGNIVEQATGQSLLLFARQHLFDPLGIGNLYWAKADSKHYHSDGGLYMIPRDMARLGYLMLNEGVWDGKQILPPEWVEQATTARYQTNGSLGYGYQWWKFPDLDVYAALGHYDQAIYVIPEADLVVVFTADVPDEAIHPESGLLIRHIIGACKDLPYDLTHKRFTDYGFTYDYGAEFMAIESPLPGNDHISDTAGVVQFSFISYPVEIITVIWNDLDRELDQELILNNAITSMSQQAGLEISEGEISQASIGSQELLVQDVIVTTEGIELSGLIGVWVCDQTDNVYVLSFITDAKLTRSDLLARFQQVMGSFSCQTSN
jgi:CubicO group peptidase (beta-lactamase class C family)